MSLPSKNANNTELNIMSHGQTRLLREDGSEVNVADALFNLEARLNPPIPNTYTVQHRVSVGAGGTAYIDFRTGSKSVHVVSSAFQTSDGSIVATLYEGATYTNGTTDVTVPANHMNRIIASANPTLSQFKSNPTGVSIASAITLSRTEFFSLAGVLAPSSPQSVASGIERVYAPNSKYLVQIQNSGLSATVVVVTFTYFEV